MGGATSNASPCRAHTYEGNDIISERSPFKGEFDYLLFLLMLIVLWISLYLLLNIDSLDIYSI